MAVNWATRLQSVGLSTLIVLGCVLLHPLADADAFTVVPILGQPFAGCDRRGGEPGAGFR